MHRLRSLCRRKLGERLLGARWIIDENEVDSVLISLSWEKIETFTSSADGNKWAILRDVVLMRFPLLYVLGWSTDKDNPGDEQVRAVKTRFD